jgi:hypothetical protein
MAEPHFIPNSPECLPEGAVPIPGFPLYAITLDGRVFTSKLRGRNHKSVLPYRHDTWHEMKVTIVKGYPKVSLRINNRPCPIGIHILLMRAFVGPPPEGMPEVRHLNDVRTDFRLENLAYGTHKQNYADAMRNGVLCHGTRRKNAKLTDDLVREILRLRDEGWMHKAIAEKLGLNRVRVTKVCLRIIWKHVKWPP